MTRKEQIIQVCMDIFSESGVQGLTMKAIADRLQISEPALYRHFRNKQDIVIAMITLIRDELFLRVDEILKQPISSIEKLHKIFEHHLFYLKEKQAITISLLSESFFYNQPEARRHLLFLMDGYHERIRAAVAVGIEKREISREVDPSAVSTLFLGSLQHLLTIFKLTGQEREVDLISEEVFNHFKTILEKERRP